MKQKFLFSEARQFQPSPESSDSTCTRTIEHPMHVISTAIPLDPLDTWPEKQDENDVKNKVRLLTDQMKKGYPSSLIIIKDDKHEIEFSFRNVNDND